jgi:hypothetical protein
MGRILNLSLLPLTALSKLTADRPPLSARRWAQLTARRSDVRCSPLDGSTAHGSPLAAPRSAGADPSTRSARSG